MSVAVNHDLLCGHWTFFRLPDGLHTARCDHEQGHEGMHKFWWNPATSESYSWADIAEIHDHAATVLRPPTAGKGET